MTDDFESRLRGALSSATDGLPGNPSRYDQTETRIRRRRRRVGIAVVAAAVVLVVAGVAAPPVLSRLIGGSVDDGLVTGTRDVGDLGCPEPSAPGGSRWTGSGPLVPDGAVSARFCPGRMGAGEAMPGDPELMKATLTRGVGELTAALNRLPSGSFNPTCTSELGPTYNLVLGYPDGRRAVIAFESFGCGVTKYGNEYRLGGDQLVDIGKRLVRGQPDAALKCPAHDAAMGVPVPGAAGPLVPDGADSARLCARDNPAGAGGGDSALSQVVFDPANAAKLAGELNALPAVDPNAVCTMELGTTYDLVLGYPDGRRVVTTFQAYGCGYAQSGQAFRMGASRIVGSAESLAEQQRLEISPPSTPPIVPQCPVRLEPGEKGRQKQLYESYTRDPDSAVPQPAAGGRLCRYSGSDDLGELRKQQELPPEQAESLRGLANQSAKQRTITCEWDTYTGPIDILLLTDRVGGRYEIRVLRGSCPALFDVNGVAKASQELLTQVDQILGPR
ncbi:hypothetical protein [Flindersiella endophytica]